MNSNKTAAIASLLLAAAVAAGAFGAHGLKDTVTEARLAVWETGVLYLLVHGVALLSIGLSNLDGDKLSLGIRSLFLGICIFSGSLFLLVLTDTAWLGAVTPIGGVLLIAGWLLLARAFFSFKSNTTDH